MKPLIFSFLAVLLIGLVPWNILLAQPASVDPERWDQLKTETEKEVQEIFALAEYRDYDQFANMYLYTGRNQQRAFRSLMDYSDPFESVEVENELNRIRSWITKADSHELSGFRIVQGLDKDLYVWNIELSRRGKVKKRKIYLAQLKGKFVFYRSE